MVVVVAKGVGTLSGKLSTLIQIITETKLNILKFPATKVVKLVQVSGVKALGKVKIRIGVVVKVPGISNKRGVAQLERGKPMANRKVKDTVVAHRLEDTVTAAGTTGGVARSSSRSSSITVSNSNGARVDKRGVRHNLEDRTRKSKVIRREM